MSRFGFRQMQSNLKKMLKRPSVKTDAPKPLTAKERLKGRIKLVALTPTSDHKTVPKFFTKKRSALARTPTIEQLIRKLESSTYHQDAIVKIEQGFVINGGELMMTPLYEYFRKKEILLRGPKIKTKVNLERIRIINQLASLGFRVAIPRYVQLGSKEPKEFYPKLKKGARTFVEKNMIREEGRLYQDSPYKSAKENGIPVTQVPVNNFWARDIYKNFMGKRTKFVEHSESRFGEGGLSVDISPTAIFASRNLGGDYNLSKFQKKGAKVYYLYNRGHRYVPELSRAFKANIYEASTHIDLFIGVVGKNILVDPYFLESNRKEIQTAAQEQGMRIISVPKTDVNVHPANFLVLGPNEILLEKRAVQTKALLESAGVKVHLTAVPLKANLSFGGGVRCMVNEIN